MTKALYRKWRPQDWDEVTSQEHVIQTLRNAVVNERVAHAYLFAGPRGTGKTTSARLLAKALNCIEPDLAHRPCNTCEYCLALNAGRFMDLIEIDAASNTSVDDVRDLREKINFSPSQGRYKVYIIDEVHMLSTAAFNALLKTLEEPPPHAIFILATTEIHKIPATVLSRCQRHEFRRIPVKAIIEHLKLKSEEEDIVVDEVVFSEIARQATGSLRDAISLLDQLTSTTDHITLKMAQNILGTATSLRVLEIISALAKQDVADGLTQIDQALDSGSDPRQLARQIVTYLRNILLYKMGNADQVEVSEEVRGQLDEHASQFSMPALLHAIEAFNQATMQEQASWHPGLGLELAFTTFLDTSNPINDDRPGPAEKKHLPEIKIESARETSTPTMKSKKKEPSEKKLQSKPTQEQKPDPTTGINQRQEPEQPETQQDTRHKSGDELTISEIQKSWTTIKSQVGNHNPRTEALLNSAKLTGLKADTLILGFSSEILKDMMDKTGNINLTKDILEEVLNRSLSIKCIVTTQGDNTIPDDLNIDKDGMVGTATRDLGGKINSAKVDE